MVNILVTGGAGFIGSHLVDALVARGHRVRVYDHLVPQVHGKGRALPEYLNREAEFVCGDVADREALRRAIRGVEVIFHLASAVGVGQSMYEIAKYTRVNTLGAAHLLDIVVNEKTTVQKLILASSMSNYGEGRYRCARCGPVSPGLRGPEQLGARDWEVRCPSCAAPVSPLPTGEEKPLAPASIYAITKRNQEEMFREIGLAYCLPTVILRYFNVYGPRQALSNPYTGVMAIFANCLLSGTVPVVFEDGRQTRDFIHVQDVVQANLLALEDCGKGVEIFNVGTGVPHDLLSLWESLQKGACGTEPRGPWVCGRFRTGDIRHCRADIGKIHSRLAFSPRWTLAEGVQDLLSWVKGQISTPVLERAISELEAKHLIR